MIDEGWVLNQTMLRIKDPERSVPFYRDILGMTLLTTYSYLAWTSAHLSRSWRCDARKPKPGEGAVAPGEVCSSSVAAPGAL